jgi:hypothetical protein
VYVTSALAPALRQRGYIAQSAAEANNLELDDEGQLFHAARHEMALLTCNARDFIPLAQQWYFAGREHAGIIITEQYRREQFGELLRHVLVLLDSKTADELRNQVVFLHSFHR